MPESSSRRERRLFNQAVEIEDPGERAAFLDRSCADDPSMRRQLESLLEASGAAELFFARPAMAPAAPSTGSAGRPSVAAGKTAEDVDYITQIGRYRLLARVGEGGHGIVYSAEQQEPVRRQVALKIIRLGMDTEAVIQRFEAERQALALMEHPYIARVLDAGAAESGRPFFVMEWVEGLRITEYCDRRRLGVNARLELFIKVCQAVQHAHQKGIIHRDIKPSNILVAEIDGQPVPKVIDFGIAKATGQRLTAHTLRTADLGQFIGTPTYMSPEHVVRGGAQMDTRSDIFSLGVVLGELLVGRPAFDAPDWGKLNPEEIRRIVADRQARPPSRVLRDLEETERASTAASRGIGAGRLQALLPGELDWIAMKAVSPERESRYESAAALAADLRAYLAHGIVQARKPGRLYAFRKFVRRHRGPVTAAALLLASLLGGLGLATRLYIREQRALDAQIELRRQTEEARENEALLRAEAEAARTHEAALRRQAEAGERIARAAVQISYGRLDEADPLVEELPLAQVRPSLESALVFRALGTWHAEAGRWTRAARYFECLAYSLVAIDPNDNEGVSRQLMPAATAIVRSGDTAVYERFRSLVIGRFRHTLDPVVAEQVLKCSLLTPVDAGNLAALEPLAKIVREATAAPDAESNPYMLGWRCFALGLFEYRKGEYARVSPWARSCLASPDLNHARTASAHLLIALSSARRDQPKTATASLRIAEALIGRRAEDTRIDRQSLTGFWFDWVNNELLLAEARSPAGLDSSDAPAPSP